MIANRRMVWRLDSSRSVNPTESPLQGSIRVGAHLRLGLDRAREPILPRDVEVLVDHGDRLVPDGLEVAVGNHQRVLRDGPR